MIVNVWIALRDDAQALVRERLEADESGAAYSGPVDNRTARLFHLMADRDVVQSLFEVATAGGRQYTLWSVYFNEPGSVLQKVRDELDRLATEYPNRFIIAGAWHWDGSQVGDYPPDARLDRFMPDGVLQDVNIMAGQSSRDFA